MAKKHVFKADFITLTGVSIRKPCFTDHLDVPWKTVAYGHAKLI